MTKDVTIEEAEARLRLEARRLHGEQMHPDGQVIDVHIYDATRGPNATLRLPWVQIRLRANGTWEYVE